MRDDTKLDILWEQMGTANSELAAVKAVTDQVAPLIPKIPKDYSTTETATGQKWIDGKEIYCRVFNFTTPQNTSDNYILDEALIIDKIILSSHAIVVGDIEYSNPYDSRIYSQAGVLKFTNYAAGSAGKNARALVWYTKPAPTREPDAETKKATKKKTTKKEEE